MPLKAGLRIVDVAAVVICQILLLFQFVEEVPGPACTCLGFHRVLLGFCDPYDCNRPTEVGESAVYSF